MKKLLQLCSVLMLGLLFLAGNAQAQTLYVDGNIGSGVGPCGGAPGLSACNSLTLLFSPASTQVFSPTTTVQVTGTTLEPSTVLISAGVPDLTGISIVGVETDPLSPNFAGVTQMQPSSPTAPIINVTTASNVEIRNLWIRYVNGPVSYDEGRLLRVASPNPLITDATILDNLILGSTTNANAVRTMFNIASGANNVTFTNSRLIGPVARSAVNVNGGGGHTVSNNLFQHTHIGSAAISIPGNPMNAAVFIGRALVTSVDVTFNRFDATVVNNGLGPDGAVTSIYIEGGHPLSAPEDILISHNTIATDGSAFSNNNVHGIYFDIDTITPIPSANDNAIASLNGGYIAVRDNVITGAVDANAGVGYGLFVPIAFGPSFASYNIFWNNEDDSNNSIDVATGPGNGNNISEDVSGAAANPLFDGTDKFGYLAGSPALGSSSTAPSALTGNRGYNQALNTTAPQIDNFLLTSTAPDAQYRVNSTYRFDWDFVDPDLADGPNVQTSFTLQISSTGNAGPYDILDHAGTTDTEYESALAGLALGGTYYYRLTVTDGIGLTDVLDGNWTTEPNVAPVASNIEVDAVFENLNVNNSSPVVTADYFDIEGADATSYQIIVTRTSDCLGCEAAPRLVWDSGVVALLAGDLLSGGTLTRTYAGTGLVNELITPDNTYDITVQFWDDAPAASNLEASFFATVEMLNPTITNLAVNGKDNSLSPRVVASPVSFTWDYNSFDAQKAYQIDVATDAGFATIVWTGAGLPSTAPVQSEDGDNGGAGVPVAYTGPFVAGNTYYARVRAFNQLNNDSNYEYISFTPNQSPDAGLIAATWTVGPVGGADVSLYPLQGPIVDNVSGVSLKWTFIDGNLANPGDDEAQSRYEIEIWDCPNFEQAGCLIANGNRRYYADVNTADWFHNIPDLELEYNDEFYVRMKVYDALGQANSQMGAPLQDWIAIGSFRTPANAAPAVAVTQTKDPGDSPVAGFTLDTTPTFDWVFTDTEGRDQFQYALELYHVEGAASYVHTGNPIAGNAAQYVFDPADFAGFAGFVPGDSYEFRLTVWDADVDSGTDAVNDGQLVAGSTGSDAYAFTFATLPSAPTGLAMAPLRAGGQVNSVTPQFSFTHVDADNESSVHYDAELFQADGLTQIELVEGVAAVIADGAGSGPVNFAGVFAAALVPNNTYNLRVRTADAHGEGAWSALLPFTVNPRPAVPTDITVTVPPVVAQMNLPNGPTFNISWTNDDFGFDAVEYRAAIFDAANAVNVGPAFAIAPAGPGNTGSFTPAVPLTPGTTYTLRLRVGDDASAGDLAEFSPVGTAQFRVSAAPTAVDLLVDGVAANPEVLTVFPTFSWTFGDVDLDTQTASEVIVTRTSTLCGGLPVCQPAPHLVWSSGKLANVNPSVLFGDGGPIIEGILPGESYSWTLRVWDSNDIPSTVYNSTFTASENLPAEISSLTLDAQSYVPGGTPATRWLEASLNVATGTPTFAWVFGGPGAQAKYQIEVSTSPTFAAGQFVWQTGEVVSGDVSVAYGGAALSAGTTYYARVRAFNGQNLASPFGYVKFVLNQAPGQPSAFSVDGQLMNTLLGTTLTADDRIPTFTWVFEDPNLLDATDEQTEFVIEIGDNVPFLTPIFTYDSELDVSIDGTLATFTVPVNQLKFGTAYAARIKVKDKHGAQSATWLYGTFRTPENTPPVISDLAVSDGNPATNPAQVLSIEPDFDWNFSDTDAHGHGFSRVEIFRVDGSVLVYDTGIVANASSAHAFNAANLVGPGLVWGEDYTARVVSWDDFSDPLNFVGPAPGLPDDVTEQVSNALTLNFSTSAFNLVPVSLAVNPSVINTLQTATITAQLSTPYAWATLTISTGVETFFASIQADAAGEASMSSGALAAGNYTFRAFETPVELNAGNYLASTYGNGASFVQASLQVVNAGGLLGDANQSGTVSALDAVFILQYTAGLQTMTPAQLALGDVDGVAGVNSFDAALILQYDASIITCFPLNCPPKTAAVEPDASVASSRAAGAKDIVLSVSGSEMLSVQYTVDLAAAGLSVADVTLGSPEGWMVASNEQDGVLTVSMAGARSVGSVDFLTLSTANVTDSKQLNVAMVVNNQALAASLEIAPALPDEFALGQNFPNPFNPSTEIAFSLPADANVVLEVYSVTGQKVATLVSGPVKAGAHTVRFDASRLSSGVYIYRIQAGSFTASQKMTLIK